MRLFCKIQSDKRIFLQRTANVVWLSVFELIMTNSRVVRWYCKYVSCCYFLFFFFNIFVDNFFQKREAERISVPFQSSFLRDLFSLQIKQKKGGTLFTPLDTLCSAKVRTSLHILYAKNLSATESASTSSRSENVRSNLHLNLVHQQIHAKLASSSFFMDDRSLRVP